MKLHTIWRPPYVSGDMPELFDAWDEWTIDANPEGYKEKLLKAGPRARVLIVNIPEKAASGLFLDPEVTGTPEEAGQ